MKKLLALSMAAAVLSMTAGCSLIPQAAPAPTVTVTASADPTPSASSTPAADGEGGSLSDAGNSSSDVNTADTTLSKTMWDYEHGRIQDEEFVAFVRKNTTTLDPYEESMLVVLAQTTCAAVANGATKQDIVEKQVAMAESRQGAVLTKEMGRDIGFLLGAGSKNYCPEISDKLVALLSS